MVRDLVSDMLTRLRNASVRKHSFVDVPYTKFNQNILKVFKKEGYINHFEIIDFRTIKIGLKYKGWWIKKPFFSFLKKISKSGQKIFSNYISFSKKFYLLKYNQGIAIISTSSGVMSHLKAQKLRKGGEIICYIE